MKAFIDLADDYKTSLEYKELRLETQRQYDYHIAIAADHFGRTRLSKIAPLSAKKAYDTWCNRGVSSPTMSCLRPRLYSIMVCVWRSFL